MERSTRNDERTRPISFMLSTLLFLLVGDSLIHSLSYHQLLDYLPRADGVVKFVTVTLQKAGDGPPIRRPKPILSTSRRLPTHHEEEETSDDDSGEESSCSSEE